MITHECKAPGWSRNKSATQKQPSHNKLLQLSLAVLLMFFGGSAWAASFTATLEGTFPLKIDPGVTVDKAFAVKLVAAGNFNQSGNQSATIYVCDAITLHADGTFTCTSTASFPLEAGNPPTGFPSDVQVSVTVASDVACGDIYGMSVDVSLDGNGADFGEDEFHQKISEVSLPFTVEVRCSDLDPQGCSQGYWKNHSYSWQYHSPSSSVGGLFSSAPAELSGKTLLEALSFKGGSTLQGAAQILLRQAVAAALNDSHDWVAYPRLLADIQEEVNVTLASESRSNILGLAAALDGDNNLGCPLE